MSYFNDAFDDYWIKNRTVENDNEGGYVVNWSNGARVKMSLDIGSASETRRAQSEGLKTVFTAVFPKNTPVRYDNYLEHVETGEVFRITSNPLDNQTPEHARFPSCYATAIRTELPKE